MRCIGDVTRWRRLVITAAIGLGAALVTQIGPSPAGASTLPTGFRDSVVLSGLTNPTVLQFAPDGRGCPLGDINAAREGRGAACGVLGMARVGVGW